MTLLRPPLSYPPPEGDYLYNGAACDSRVHRWPERVAQYLAAVRQVAPAGAIIHKGLSTTPQTWYLDVRVPAYRYLARVHVCIRALGVGGVVRLTTDTAYDSAQTSDWPVGGTGTEFDVVSLPFQIGASTSPGAPASVPLQLTARLVSALAFTVVLESARITFDPMPEVSL